MGAFSNLFKIGARPIPRVSIMEAFAENADDSLSAPELVKITNVSRRAVYIILNDLVNEGILVRLPKTQGQKAQYYTLNPNDARAASLAYLENLLTIGSIESKIKVNEGIPQSELLPNSILSVYPKYLPARTQCLKATLNVDLAANSLEDRRLEVEKRHVVMRTPSMTSSASTSIHSMVGWGDQSDAELICP